MCDSLDSARVEGAVEALKQSKHSDDEVAGDALPAKRSESRNRPGSSPQKNPSETFRKLRAAVHADPGNPRLQAQLGNFLWQTGHRIAANVAFARATRLAPDEARWWIRRGAALRELGRLEEAKQVLRQALRLEPRNARATFELGSVFRDDNDPDEAIATYRRAHEILDDGDDEPALAREIDWWTAVALLQQGKYREAWAYYEKRLALERVPQPAAYGPRWNGESLKGKTILLAWEQRFGDAIHFVRFASHLKKLGATVVVECPEALEDLVRRVDGVDDTKAPSLDTFPCDYCLPMTSVPAVLDLDYDAIPGDVPYIRIPDNPGVRLPGDSKQLKVGLVWAGKPKPDRSIPLVLLAPLFEHPQVNCYSFQVGARRRDLVTHRLGWLCYDLSRHFETFLQSAELLRQMDLVVTIDSAPAHLAGALGLPTWVLLRYHADWRWGLDADRTPWYPTARLFRQASPGSWRETARALSCAFEAWVSTARPSTE